MATRKREVPHLMPDGNYVYADGTVATFRCRGCGQRRSWRDGCDDELAEHCDSCAEAITKGAPDVPYPQVYRDHRYPGEIAFRVRAGTETFYPVAWAAALSDRLLAALKPDTKEPIGNRCQSGEPLCMQGGRIDSTC